MQEGLEYSVAATRMRCYEILCSPGIMAYINSTNIVIWADHLTVVIQEKTRRDDRKSVYDCEWHDVGIAAIAAIAAIGLRV